jgi:hypothetical protein
MYTHAQIVKKGNINSFLLAKLSGNFLPEVCYLEGVGVWLLNANELQWELKK